MADTVSVLEIPIRRFTPVHATTMQGQCSAACVEKEAGPFVTHSDHMERIAELERQLAAITDQRDTLARQCNFLRL